MSLPASRSSASFICRSCRALPGSYSIVPSRVPETQSRNLSTTPTTRFSHSNTKAKTVSPYARARANHHSRGSASSIKLHLLKTGFSVDHIPNLDFWQSAIASGVVADKSITARELHETAVKYAQLAVQDDHGGPAKDPQLTTKYDIRLIALFYVEHCLLTLYNPKTIGIQAFMLHITLTLVSVHEYQPAVLNAARQRGWTSGRIVTDEILKRKFKEGGDGRGFVDANAATLAGLQCLWEVENLRGDAGKSGSDDAVVQPDHAVHPSKRNGNSRNAKRSASIHPLTLASINRARTDGLHWFRRAVQLGAEQEPGTWDWEATCYRGMADLYDIDSPKERPLKIAALEHLAVKMDNMDGCYRYAMVLPLGSEMRENMMLKAAASGHSQAQKEMERVYVDKLRKMDEAGTTEEEVKNLVIMADEWGAMSQVYNPLLDTIHDRRPSR